jgi:hypothetical protein
MVNFRCQLDRINEYLENAKALFLGISRADWPVSCGLNEKILPTMWIGSIQSAGGPDRILKRQGLGDSISHSSGG